MACHPLWRRENWLWQSLLSFPWFSQMENAKWLSPCLPMYHCKIWDLTSFSPTIPKEMLGAWSCRFHIPQLWSRKGRAAAIQTPLQGLKGNALHAFESVVNLSFPCSYFYCESFKLYKWGFLLSRPQRVNTLNKTLKHTHNHGNSLIYIYNLGIIMQKRFLCPYLFSLLLYPKHTAHKR